MSPENQKHLFSLEEGVHYLNCAYMSPLLKSVENAGITGIEGKKRPYSVSPEDFFTDSDKVREQFAKLIKADNPMNVALIPSVSYGMAVVAKNLPCNAGGEIVVVEEQFPSNIYSWQRLAEEKGLKVVTVKAPASANRGEAWNAALLEAINERTCLLALPHTHWADGTRFDLAALRQKTKEHGAWMVVDGTQSVGALPFSVEEFQPDALICAGYKWLMGPYSTGLAYFGPAFSEGVPLEENWINRYNSQDFAGLVSYENRYQPGALRFEVGEHSNFILVPMLLKALEQINNWTPEGIQQYAGNLLSDFIPQFEQKGFRIEQPEWRGNHLFGLRKTNLDTALLAAKLKENKVYISVRGTSLRISLHVWNDVSDLEMLLKLL